MNDNRIVEDCENPIHAINVENVDIKCTSNNPLYLELNEKIFSYFRLFLYILMLELFMFIVVGIILHEDFFIILMSISYFVNNVIYIIKTLKIKINSIIVLVFNTISCSFWITSVVLYAKTLKNNKFNKLSCFIQTTILFYWILKSLYINNLIKTIIFNSLKLISEILGITGKIGNFISNIADKIEIEEI